MPKVYTTVPGAVVRLGAYGEASNDAPAIVPDEVAAELAPRRDVRVEREAAPEPVRGRKRGQEPQEE